MFVRRVEAALPFNCPFCNVGIGELCLSRSGLEMARFVHPEREPIDVLRSAFTAMVLREWLEENGHILMDVDGNKD